MRRYLFDTGVASDYICDRKGVQQRARALVKLGHRIGLCPPVYGELLGGIEASQTREYNLKQLRRFRSHFSMWHFDEEAVMEYGRLFALLTGIGRPMQQIDMQIAAVAFAKGKTTVVTYDSDFSAIPGLKVENWLESP